MRGKFGGPGKVPDDLPGTFIKSAGLKFSISKSIKIIYEMAKEIKRFLNLHLAAIVTGIFL